MKRDRTKYGMTPETRKTYFGLWNSACVEQGWNPKDTARRREVTLHVARECGFESNGSSTTLTPHQVTALFVYLTAKGRPTSGQAQHDWKVCRADYVTFARLLMSEHFRKKAGYKAGGKMDQNIHGVHFAAEIEDHTLSPQQVTQRLITNARRAHTKEAAREGMHQAIDAAREQSETIDIPF